MGDDHHVVRASKPLTDRADISVGPVRIEVVEPLRKLRVIVEPGRPGRLTAGHGCHLDRAR